MAEQEDVNKKKFKGKKTVLEAINRIFSERISCKTEEELGMTCLLVAQELTGSKFGFIGELNKKGLFNTTSITNPGWDACNIPEGQAKLIITDMPIRGVDRMTVKEGKSRIVNGAKAIRRHPDHVEVPQGHPVLTAFLGVPLKDEGKTIGMIGLGNKEGGYTKTDQENIEALAVAVVEATRSKRAEEALKRSGEEMEAKVRERTAEIQRANETLREQQRAIMELSTPVIAIWEGIITLPLIGIVDSSRAKQIMENLLNAIVETQASTAVIDITGVPMVDTEVADRLMRTVKAASLLGTECIVVGIRPEIAETLVGIGVDLSGIETCATLQAGLKAAFSKMGLKVERL